MKNRLFFRLLILAVVTVFTVTSCKDYDDDITRLDKSLTDLKNSIPEDKSQVIDGLTTDLAAVKGEVAAAKEKLATLEKNGATQEQLNKAKEELMSKLVKAEAYEAFVKKMEDDLKNLKADLAKASTKEEVEALSKIYATKAELKAQQTALEAALGLKVDDPKTAEQLKDQIAKIKANEAAIKELKGVIEGNIPETSELLAAIKKGLDLDNKLKELKDADGAMQKQIDALKEKLGDIKVVDVINLSFNHLKSLVLYPELYVNGVEAIVFRPLIIWKEEPFSPTDPDGCPIDPPTVPCLGEIGDLVSLGEDEGTLRVITPTTRVKYNVNPSSLSLAMIDKDNLEVTSHWAKFRAGGVEDELPNPFNAKYVGLENGKMIVDLTVDPAKFADVYSPQVFLYGGDVWVEDGRVGPVLALQVPHSKEALKQLPEGTNSYVTSDYARTLVEAIKDVDIAKKQYEYEYGTRDLLPDFLGNPEKETDSKGRPLTHRAGYPAGRDNAKALRDGVNNGTPADIRLILLEEGSEINLLDSIQGVAKHYYYNHLVTINPEDYGFTWKFDLLDGNDQPIKYELTTNKTDQQKFIELLDGEKGRVKAKVYGDEAQGAAVDRTPIVRVRIMKDDCMVSQAFIKVLIVKKAAHGPGVVDLGTYEAKTPSGCDDAKHRMTVEEVNRFIYNKLKMSKEEFVEVYGPWTNYEVVKQGSFRWITDYSNGRTTYLPEWSISICEVNFCGKSEANVQSSVIIKAKKGGYPNLKLNYQVTIKAPVIALTEADFNKAYWDDPTFSYVRHHSQKPVTGSEDPNTFTYTTNINAAFKTHANHLLKLDKDYMQYEYTFAPVDPDLGGAPENQITKDASNGKVTVRISDDGKQLFAKMNKDVKVKIDGVVTTIYTKNNEYLIATITDHTATNIKDPKGEDMLTYAQTPLAKYLLNEGADFMWAKLQITAKCPCGPVEVPVTVNGMTTFNVHFLRPINPNPTSVEHFEDGVDFGKKGSILDIEKLAGLADWRDDKFAENKNYMKYYDVKTIRLAEDKVLWDANGKKEVIPSTLEVYWIDKAAVEALDAKNDAKNKLIDSKKSPYDFGGVAYDNNNNVVNKDFNLYIPIQITYKFGTIISETVKVQVKKTNAPTPDPKP